MLSHLITSGPNSRSDPRQFRAAMRQHGNIICAKTAGLDGRAESSGEQQAAGGNGLWRRGPPRTPPDDLL